MNRKALISLTCTALAVVVLDQASKDLVLQNISPGEMVAVVPGIFNLTLNFNPGVAFGLFASMPEAQRQIAIGFTTVLALSVVAYLFMRDFRHDLKAQVALSLVVGGAIGNLIDRLQHGHVVDFLDFYWRSYHWPAFNLADSSICVGVTFLVLYSLLSPAPKSEAVNRS